MRIKQQRHIKHTLTRGNREEKVNKNGKHINLHKQTNNTFFTSKYKQTNKQTNNGYKQHKEKWTQKIITQSSVVTCTSIYT